MKNVKMISRIIAVAMVLSNLPALGMSASAEDSIEWSGGYTIDFDNATDLTGISQMAFNTNDSFAATLVDNTTEKYLSIKNNTAAKLTYNTYDAGLTGALLKIDQNKNADYVKVSYRAKVNPTGAQSSWGNSSVADKFVWNKTAGTGYDRQWGVRANSIQTQILNQPNGADTQKYVDHSSWFDVEYLYDTSTKLTTGKISQSGEEIMKKTYNTPEGAPVYLLIAARGGNETNPVYYDDFTVSYGYNKPQNFTIDFEDGNVDQTYGAVKGSNVTAAIVNDDTHGKVLSLTNSNTSQDADSYYAVTGMENGWLADKIYISYDAKIPNFNKYNEASFFKSTSIATKFVSSTGNNAWAARMSKGKYQLSGQSAATSNAATNDWYTVEHEITTASKTVKTRITDSVGKIVGESSETSTAIGAYQGNIKDLRLGTADGTQGEVYYDNIKVMFDHTDSLSVDMGNGNYVTGKNNTGATWYIADVTASGYAQTFTQMTLTDENDNKTKTEDLTTAITLADGASVSIGIIINGGNYTEHNITATVQ